MLWTAFLVNGLNLCTSQYTVLCTMSYYVVRRVFAVNLDCAEPWDGAEFLQADRRKSYIQNIAAGAHPSPVADVQPSSPI